MKLNDIPKKILHPTKKNVEFTHIAAIQFKGPTNVTGNSDVIGHYTAILRRGNSWREYDDLREKDTVLSKNTEITISLLFYFNKANE